MAMGSASLRSIQALETLRASDTTRAPESALLASSRR